MSRPTLKLQLKSLKTENELYNAVAYFADLLMSAVSNSTPLNMIKNEKKDIQNIMKQVMNSKRKPGKLKLTKRHIFY